MDNETMVTRPVRCTECGRPTGEEVEVRAGRKAPPLGTCAACAALSEKRVEASCLRCYVWGDDLDVNAIADALADALVEQGFGVGSDDDAINALIAVTPDTLPLDGGEEELVRAIEDLNAGLFVIPQKSAPHE